MSKWQGWRKWNMFDAGVLFWGITMVTTVIYTVLALSAARIDPTAADKIGPERIARRFLLWPMPLVKPEAASRA